MGSGPRSNVKARAASIAQSKGRGGFELEGSGFATPKLPC